jgi:hypothetical protein
MGFEESKALLTSKGNPSNQTVADDEEEFQIEFKPSD